MLGSVVCLLNMWDCFFESSKANVLCGFRWLLGTVVIAAVLQTCLVFLCENYKTCHKRGISLEQESKLFLMVLQQERKLPGRCF